ncbi:MAG: hypothetical protein C0620_05490 [Desulfuromonas sp.]|nr:MAG: hypothetical protein C0620_05490 [Desulfuromonas sp.]
MRERQHWRWGTLSSLPATVLIFLLAVSTVWAEDITVTTDEGQQTLAVGDTLTVSGSVTTTDTDSVYVSLPPARIYTPYQYDADYWYSLDSPYNESGFIDNSAIIGEDSTFSIIEPYYGTTVVMPTNNVTTGSITINSGATVSATTSTDSVTALMDQFNYTTDVYTNGIKGETGNLTITNNGTLAVSSNITTDDRPYTYPYGSTYDLTIANDIHSIGIQLDSVIADSGVEGEGTTIINNGLMDIEAIVVDGSISNQTNNAKAEAIQIMGASETTVSGIDIQNNGTMDLYASGENAHAWAIQTGGGNDGEFSNLSISNSGTVEAIAEGSENSNTRWIQTGGYIDGLEISNTGDVTISSTTTPADETSTPDGANAMGIKLGEEIIGLTITNAADATLTVSATGTNSDSTSAQGIHLGELIEDMSITNNGTIAVSSLSQATEGSDVGETTAWGIAIGEESTGTLDNAGTITVSAVNEADSSYATSSRGIKVAQDSSITINNTGTIEATSSTASDDEAMARAIHLGQLYYSENPGSTIINAEGATLSATATSDNVDAESVGAYGIQAGDDALYSLKNYGTIEATTTGYYSNKSMGIKVEGSTTIDNYGVITADLTSDTYDGIESSMAAGVVVADSDSDAVRTVTNYEGASIDVTANYGTTEQIGYLYGNSGAFGVRVNYDGIRTVANAGDITTTTNIDSYDGLEDNLGSFGIFVGEVYDAAQSAAVTNEATGTISATATIAAEGSIESSVGAFGIKTGSNYAYSGDGNYTLTVDNAGAIEAVATLTVDDTDGNNGAFGIRTGTAKITNTGSISATATINGLDDDSYDGAFGIRTGEGEATVISSGDIVATLTDNDATTAQMAAGIMTGYEDNQIHISGNVSATATGGDAYSVVMGCEDSYSGESNALMILDGASLTGDVLNASSGGTANVIFGLTADSQGMADFGSYGDVFTFGNALFAAVDPSTVMNELSVDSDFDFTYSGDFVGTTDGWNALLMGGTTSLNNSDDSMIEELAIAPLATLGGNAFVDNLLAFGTIAPGNSIGTVTVSGDMTQEAGSTYAVELAEGMASDLITVAGTATIDAEATVAVTELGYISDGDIFTILEAGTLSGTYGSLTESSLFVDYELDYATANTVQLVASRTSYEDAGLTGNTLDVVTALEEAALAGDEAASAFIASAESLDSIEAMEAVLENIIPDMHSSLLDVTLSGTTQFQTLLAGRMGTLHITDTFNSESGPALARMTSVAGEDARYSGWARVMGMSGDQDKDGDYDGYEFDSHGLAIGFDTKVMDGLAVGASFGFSSSDVDFDHQAQTTDVDSYYGSIYATYSADKFYVDGAITYADNDYDSKRALSLGSGYATSSADGQEYGVYIGGGCFVINTDSMYLVPTASVSWGKAEIDSFTEHGELDLYVDDYDTDSIITTLGMRLGAKLDNIEPELRLAWAHEFGDTDRDVTVSLGGPTTYTLNGVEPERDSALVGVGVNTFLNEQVTFSLDYDAEIRDDFFAHALSGELRYSF